MQRFHFNLSDGKNYRDVEGVELPNFAAARWQAVQYLADTLRDDPAEVFAGEITVEVTDDSNLVLCTLTVVSPVAPAARSIIKDVAK